MRSEYRSCIYQFKIQNGGSHVEIGGYTDEGQLIYTLNSLWLILFLQNNGFENVLEQWVYGGEEDCIEEVVYFTLDERELSDDVKDEWNIEWDIEWKN